MSTSRACSQETDAKLVNCEEAIAVAIRQLAAIPGAEGVSEMLKAVLGTDGSMHLKVIQQAEQLQAAVLAFRSNVIDRMCIPECPLCSGTDGMHTSGCLAEVAINMTPDLLLMHEPRAMVSLMTLRNRMQSLQDKSWDGDRMDKVRSYLEHSLAEAPIPGTDYPVSL